MSGTTKTVWGIALAVLALAALLWYAKPVGGNRGGEGSKNAPGVLTLDRNSHDFGTISMKNGLVRTAFSIKNSSNAPLSLDKIYTSCMCTEATLKIRGRTRGPFGMPGHGFLAALRETLAPDEEAEVEVAFDPAAHGPAGVGMIQRAVMLESDEETLAEIRIKANVTP